MYCWHWARKCWLDSTPWCVWKCTFQKIIACRGVLGSLSNLASLWTTNCLGTQPFLFLPEPNPSNFYILSGHRLCIFICLHVCKKLIKPIRRRDLLSKFIDYLTNLFHAFSLVDSLSYICKTSTKIPSTLSHSFYVVVFWEAPLLYKVFLNKIMHRIVCNPSYNTPTCNLYEKCHWM